MRKKTRGRRRKIREEGKIEETKGREKVNELQGNELVERYSHQSG